MFWVNSSSGYKTCPANGRRMPRDCIEPKNKSIILVYNLPELTRVWQLRDRNFSRVYSGMTVKWLLTRCWGWVHKIYSHEVAPPLHFNGRTIADSSHFSIKISHNAPKWNLIEFIISELSFSPAWKRMMKKSGGLFCRVVVGTTSANQ
jgi:hypothetical protein